MLTAPQIEQFHRDGFLVIPHVFAGRELELLCAAAERIEAEAVAGKGKDHRYRDVNGRKTYYRTDAVFDRDPIFQAVTTKPALLEAVGQCIGMPFLPVNDAIVNKSPRSNVPVEWHQDPPYLDPQCDRTVDVPNFVTDIYLDDSTVENGCVWGLPGRHLVGHVDYDRYTEDELFEKFGAVPMVMKPGDVLFHAVSAPHGSVGNTSDRKRRIYYVHYMARRVWDHDYTQWHASMRGFNPEGFAMCKRMPESRRSLGFADLSSPQVRWTDEGYEFTGEPRTEPFHWGKLAAALTTDKRERLRHLEWPPRATRAAAPATV